jgi:hypothetical protein
VSPRTRGRRAGRLAWVSVLLAGAAGAIWGVPIDADRVAAVVRPGEPIRMRARRARLALRPFPTIVASDVHLAFDDRLRAELPSVAIVLAAGRLVRGDVAWARVRLRRGRVVLGPAAEGGPIRCAAIGGRISAAGGTGARLDVSGDCTTHGLGLTALRFRGEVDWRRGRAVRAWGRVTADAPTIGGVAGTGLTAALRAGPDGVRADDVRLAIGGGTIVGRGRWLRVGGRQRVAVAFEGSGGAAGEAFGSVALRVDGRWRVRGRGRAAARTGVPLGRAVSGHGRLVVLDGSVEPLDVGGALLGGLEIWRSARRRRLRDRFPDVFGGPRLRYDRAVVRARARRGRYHLAPIRARSESYRAEGAGRLGRDGLVRGEIRVVPSTALADALLGRGALRAIVGGSREEIVLPIEVTGRPGALEVRPAPTFTREVLERALGGSALGHALERLLAR